MINRMKRMLLLIAIVTLVQGSVAFPGTPASAEERGKADVVQELVSYELDMTPSMSQIRSENMLFFNANRFKKTDDNKLFVDNTTWDAAGTFRPVMAPLIGQASFSLQYDASNSYTNSLMLGIRIKDQSNLFIDTGLWFMFLPNEITLMVNHNDSTRVAVKTDDDYSVENKYYLEDTGSEINLYTKNGDEKEMIIRTVIEGNELKVYDSNGNHAGSIPDFDLPNTGYFRLMIHFADALVGSFGYEYMEAYNKYEPADTSAYRDILSDTWTGYDENGLPFASHAEAGDRKTDQERYVGIFYHLWHTQTTGKIFDNNRAYLDGGVEGFLKSFEESDIGVGRYWAEPYFGYYKSADEWIIRKHALMMADAGVDFIYIDVTNGVMYDEAVASLFKVYRQMTEEGLKTPKVVFFVSVVREMADEVVNILWRDYYSKGLYSDLYFYWDGKPLILGNMDKVDPSIKDTFTWRYSWAWEDWLGDGINKWAWETQYPQKPGFNLDGELEQISVLVGGGGLTGPLPMYARSLLNREIIEPLEDYGFSLTDNKAGLGLAFNQQWEQAHAVDPRVVMVTGWNEWTAGRWTNADSIGQYLGATQMIGSHMSYSVDNLNPEFSRDAEPMNGGFNDNYYNYLTSNVRKYKGARAVEKTVSLNTIDLDGGFDQWNSIPISYYDTLYDTVHRHSESNFGGAIKYVNETGRNDLDTAKVAFDQEHVYFYVSAKEDIVVDGNVSPGDDAALANAGENWMNLFINSDRSFDSGWYGYDYAINRSRDGSSVSVERSVDGWNWTKVADASYRVSGNEMMIAVPISVFGDIDGSSFEFEFKWADNSTKDGTIMQFYDLGDAAPNDRFSYLFTASVDDFVSQDNKSKGLGIWWIVGSAVLVLGCAVYAVLRVRRGRAR